MVVRERRDGLAAGENHWSMSCRSSVKLCENDVFSIVLRTMSSRIPKYCGRT
jgi:hypothetical protein